MLLDPLFYPLVIFFSPGCDPSGIPPRTFYCTVGYSPQSFFSFCKTTDSQPPEKTAKERMIYFAQIKNNRSFFLLTYHYNVHECKKNYVLSFFKKSKYIKK